MKKTFEQIIDFQIICATRVEQEKLLKKTTKLGEVMKLMIGNPTDRIRGKFNYLADLLEEKRENARRENCSVDKDGNILRGEITQTDKNGNTSKSNTGPYLYTPEKDTKCALALKNILQETVTIDVEKDCVFTTELPANLTEGEIYHCLGLLFTQETLDAWKIAQEQAQAEIEPEKKDKSEAVSA